MRKIKFLLLLIISIFYIININAFELKKLWSSKNLLKTPESVIYDKKNNVLYVSNINGSPSKKDGNGFISVLSTDGKIIELKMIDKLNAPKGLGIHDSKLYTADIDELIIIDLIKKEIKRKVKIKNAKFLNDIAVDNNGNVYISDMNDNKIYRYQNGSISIFFDSNKLYFPNGLYVYNNKLFVGNRKELLEINIETKKIGVFMENTGMIDGIGMLNKNTFIISNFMNKVQIVTKTNKNEILNTSQENKNAADLFYINDKNILLIPTFKANTIDAYLLK